MNDKALGLIETYGCIAAIEAADVGLKAANVGLIGVELVSGGLVTVKINGETGAVKAAVEAAGAAAQRLGKLISVHVIPRPASDTNKIIDEKKPMAAALQDEKVETTESPCTGVLTDQMATANSTIEAADITGKLRTMKVVEMRSFARELEGISMERNHIKFAKREELLKAILDYYGIGEQED